MVVEEIIDKSKTFSLKTTYSKKPNLLAGLPTRYAKNTSGILTSWLNVAYAPSSERPKRNDDFNSSSNINKFSNMHRIEILIKEQATELGIVVVLGKLSNKDIFREINDQILEFI